MTIQTVSQSVFIPTVGNPPSKDLFLDKANDGEHINHRNWVNWTNSISNLINNAEYYGNPSEALNSDFYWQRGITTPITQADGDGAFFAEKWQIHGASVATYTITTTAYAADASDQIGSIYYENFDISNYTGNGSNSDFYAYQRTATQSCFLRRFQERIVSMSCNVTNNLPTLASARFEIYFYFDGDTPQRFMGNNFEMQPGFQEVSDQIETIPLAGITIGVAPYVEFRFVICNLENNISQFNLGDLKVEIADQASILYVDHALEKTRIDNS